VLLLPRRALHGAIIGTVLIGIAVRLAGVLAGLKPLTLYANTFSACDALGLGSLLAYYEHTGAVAHRHILGRLGAAGLALAAALYVGKMLLPGRELLFQCYEIALALGGRLSRV